MKKQLLHPGRDEISLEGVLHALGDPVRLKIVAELQSGTESPCCKLSGELPKSTLSRHFQLLREMGLIRQRRHGTEVLNSLRRDDLDALFPNLLETIFQAQKTSVTTA